MKNSKPKIEIIQPTVFSDEKEMRAFFTLKNSAFSTDKNKIEGLNLGYNTAENSKIVTDNRRQLLNDFDINPDWIAFANQTHGNCVQVVTSGGTFANTDALITQVSELALAIQVADCAAILIADPTSHTIAAIHAGWRGTAKSIVHNTTEKMKKIGANLSRAKAFITPCICIKHFEVGQEVADQFPDTFVDYQSYEKPHIDLKKYLKHQLIEEGLPADHIEVHPGCTMEENNQYYSYRREQEKSGRMVAVIQL